MLDTIQYLKECGYNWLIGYTAIKTGNRADTVRAIFEELELARLVERNGDRVMYIGPANGHGPTTVDQRIHHSLDTEIALIKARETLKSQKKLAS